MQWKTVLWNALTAGAPLLAFPFPCPTYLSMLCLHFYLFEEKWKFLTKFLLSAIGCPKVSCVISAYLHTFQSSCKWLILLLHWKDIQYSLDFQRFALICCSVSCHGECSMCWWGKRVFFHYWTETSIEVYLVLLVWGMVFLMYFLFYVFTLKMNLLFDSFIPVHNTFWVTLTHTLSYTSSISNCPFTGNSPSNCHIFLFLLCGPLYLTKAIHMLRAMELHIWSMGNSAVTTLLKNEDSLSSSSH